MLLLRQIQRADLEKSALDGFFYLFFFPVVEACDVDVVSSIFIDFFSIVFENIYGKLGYGRVFAEDIYSAEIHVRDFAETYDAFGAGLRVERFDYFYKEVPSFFAGLLFHQDNPFFRVTFFQFFDYILLFFFPSFCRFRFSPFSIVFLRMLACFG